MVVGPMRGGWGTTFARAPKVCSARVPWGVSRWEGRNVRYGLLVSPRARDRDGSSRSTDIDVEASAKIDRVVVPEAVSTLRLRTDKITKKNQTRKNQLREFASGVYVETVM
jgi:hypothetical protein